MPGMVNAHSHAFQRVIRGRTEHRAAARDSFWTWREMMYSAASRLTPEDLYDASRMAFIAERENLPNSPFASLRTAHVSSSSGRIAGLPIG